MPIDLIVTIALAVVILAITIGTTARHHAVRPLVIGVGLAALVVGLYLTGVTRLVGNGVMSLIDWFQRTVFTNTVAWGLGLAVGGLVLAGIGIALPKRAPRAAETDERRTVAGPAARKPTPQVGGATPVAAAKPTTTTTTQPGAKGKAVDPEDAEIEALLRQRGIL